MEYRLYLFQMYFLSRYFFVRDTEQSEFHQYPGPFARVQFRFSLAGLSSSQPVSGLEWKSFPRPFDEEAWQSVPQPWAFFQSAAVREMIFHSPPGSQSGRLVYIHWLPLY